ncbi:hypothetical protein BOQ55_13575, partial [Lacticaseibacillus casei]
TTNGRPDRLVTDQYRATLKAVKHLIKQDYLSKSAHQCSKYRNLNFQVKCNDDNEFLIVV